MKKGRSKWTRVLTLLLSAALLFALAACGGEKQEETNQKTDGQEPANDEYVYVAEYTSINGDFQNGLNARAFTDDCAYAVSYEMIADNTPEGVTPEYEGQYWEYGQVLYRVNFDGSYEKLNYTPTPIPEGAQGSTGINNIIAMDDGTLCLLENIYTYTLEGMPEDVEEYSDEYWQLYNQYYQSEEIYKLRILAADGTEVSSVTLENLAEEGEYFYPYNFAMDKDGNIYLPCDAYLYVLDSTGALLFKLEAEGWIENVIQLRDGSVVCTNYGSSGYQLSTVDLATQSFGESIPLPANVYEIVPGGGEYDFYYTNGVNFYGYSIAEQKSSKILNWISCDIDSNNVSSRNIHVNADDSITILSYTWNSDYSKATSELTTLSKKPASSVPKKTIITLATQYLNYNVRSQIIEFNKSNDQYRIEVLDYSEYNTNEDYSAGLTKLTTEILAGNMPDILDLNGIPVSQLASKGYLEDLYPYLDSDGELSREDIFPSVLTAMETDGKLYTTCDSFYVDTVLGATSVVGEEPGWTVDEFKAALASMPEGCTAFNQYTTKSDILYQCMALDLDNYVNWSTGECNFNSEGFIDMLEFVNSFPSEFDWENYEWTEEDEETTRIASGKQMLMSTSISNFSDFQMYKAIFGAIFGGEVTCIGYPTAYGTGNMLRVYSGYAMSSKCENKEGAWQFLRQFFTEEYQEKSNWRFPTNINAFNKRLEEAMTPQYMKDENGNYILDENGNKIEQSQGGWGWGSVSIEIYALTQEEADQILDLINSTTKVYRDDESIYNIVTEEAAAYFEGQKSAEEVARLIQSKANIYVNEQR